MNRSHVIFILFILVSLQLTGQIKLSPKATLSVITCGPGNELYSTFGHSAFKISDPTLGIDKVYNYGTFNFNTPNFYLNFAKGKLTYQLDTSGFRRFLWTYNYENRWVKSQELDLDPNEVQSVFDFLENNATPKNKFYRYDFFYNNCSTKIEEVLKTVLKEKVVFSNTHITSNKTHRDLIADYTSNHKWSKFGIDLALGSVIDKKATKDNYKFLPDYIYKAFNNATITTNNNQRKLVRKSSTVLKEKEQYQSYSIVKPFIIFLLILLFVVFKTFKNHQLKTRTKWVDFVLYLSTGIIGVVVLLLWFATSHTATYKNFNFLWAFAPNLVIAFYMFKSKLPKWVIYYNWMLLVLLVSMLLLWISKVQLFNIALFPLVVALFIRYRYLTVSTKIQTQK